MRWRRIIMIILLGPGLGLGWVFGEEGERVVEIEALAPGDILYNYETGLGVVTNTFVVRVEGATLTADRGQFDERTGDVLVEGRVILSQDNQVWRGSRLQYNFLDRRIRTADFRTGRWPLYAAGRGLDLDLTNEVYVAEGAYMTSDDVAEPGYRVKARRLTIAPGRYFEARDAVVYLGKVPVFYFPYMRRALGERVNRVSVLPGYRSLYGPYLLGSYEWYWEEKLGGVVHADYRVKRGFGTGLDLSYDGGRRLGQTDFKGYYLHDIGSDDTEGEFGQLVPLDSDRYRIAFTHLSEPLTNFTIRAAVRADSDAYLRRDFFETEYRENQQPATFLELDRSWLNLDLNLMTQKRLNDWYGTTERLPDLKLTSYRTQLGPTPFFYEGESSLGYFERRFPVEVVADDFSAWRADTFHQLLMPLTYFGWLNITPRAGARYTGYGETDSAGLELDAADRWVVNAGAELSFKVSRLWPGVSNRFFELDGVRHIMQPALNYTYVPDPSTPVAELPQFDPEWPSLELLPHWFPDYNSVDSITSRQATRLGLRNRIQTKRGGQVEDVVDWDLYGDWNLEKPDGEGRFSDFFSDLDLKPWSWVTLTSQLRVDVEDPRIRISNHTLTLSPNDIWSWQFGHRYLREEPQLGFTQGHNLLLSTLYYRLNENWGLRMSHHYEMSDSTLEEQFYTVYRDFRSWTGALTFRVRDNRSDELDFTVAFTFQLKAFPRYSPGSDRNKPSLLLGG
ncbi:MAG: LPS-assembly protein LptD [Limisphaerales bacterium]